MGMLLTDTQKINWVRITAVIATLILMVYAPELWITTKDFPVVPLFDWIPIPKYPADYILAVGFFLTQIYYIFKPKRWLGIVLLLLYVYLSFVDQNRLQPYFYQSFLTIFAIDIFKDRIPPKKILYAIILIFFATYFWSGIQKLNDIFYIQWMSALEKHFSFIPTSLLQFFTYCVPWLEASMGILLLFNATRKFAVAFIVLMHGIIVFLLFYLGYGYNVVPWNFQNIISVIILFWGLRTETFHEFFTTFFNYQKAVILVFTLLLPLSNLFGIYDHLLSFSFFTSKLKYYNIVVSEKLEEQLPGHIQQYYRVQDKQTYINVNEWAGDVNKVLFYPENRAIQFLNQYLRSFAENPDQEGLTTLVVYNQEKNN